MRAAQIVEESGPAEALRLVDVPEPDASHMLTPGSGVVVDVRAAGVSFPEVLQSRGQYQFRPPLPFVPGSEVSGIVRSAPEDGTVRDAVCDLRGRLKPLDIGIETGGGGLGYRLIDLRQPL